MDRKDRPGGYTWGVLGLPSPTAIPQQMPDRKDQPETLLVDQRGRPILVRQPRPFGFRKP